MEQLNLIIMGCLRWKLLFAHYINMIKLPICDDVHKDTMQAPYVRQSELELYPYIFGDQQPLCTVLVQPKV
jgi:hypothetical protein